MCGSPLLLLLRDTSSSWRRYASASSIPTLSPLSQLFLSSLLVDGDDNGRQWLLTATTMAVDGDDNGCLTAVVKFLEKFLEKFLAMFLAMFLAAVVDLAAKKTKQDVYYLQ
jgi:hypothetical protein